MNISEDDFKNDGHINSTGTDNGSPTVSNLKFQVGIQHSAYDCETDLPKPSTPKLSNFPDDHLARKLPDCTETCVTIEDKMNETNGSITRSDHAQDSDSSSAAEDTSSMPSPKTKDERIVNDLLVIGKNFTVKDDGPKSTTNEFKVPDATITNLLHIYRSPCNSRQRRKSCIGGGTGDKRVSAFSRKRSLSTGLCLLSGSGEKKPLLIDKGEFAGDFSSYAIKRCPSSVPYRSGGLCLGEQLRGQGMALIRKRIFSYLPALDLIRCQRVCQSWKAEAEIELRKRPRVGWHTEYNKNCTPAGQAEAWDNVNTFLKELWFPAAHVLLLTTKRMFRSSDVPQSNGGFIIPAPEEDDQVVKRMARNLPSDCVISGAVSRAGLTGTSSDLADPVTYEGWEMVVALFVLGRRSNLKLVPENLIRGKAFPEGDMPVDYDVRLSFRFLPEDMNNYWDNYAKKQSRDSAICLSAEGIESKQMTYMVVEDAPIIFAMGPRPSLESFWNFRGKYERESCKALQCLMIKGTGVSHATHLITNITQQRQIVKNVRNSYSEFADKQLKLRPGYRPLLAIQRVSFATGYSQQSTQRFHYLLRMCNRVFRDTFPGVPLLGTLSERESGLDSRQNELWSTLVTDILNTRMYSPSPSDRNDNEKKQHDSVSAQGTSDPQLDEEPDSESSVNSVNINNVTNQRGGVSTTCEEKKESVNATERPQEFMLKRLRPMAYLKVRRKEDTKEKDGIEFTQFSFPNPRSTGNGSKRHEPSPNDATSDKYKVGYAQNNKEETNRKKKQDHEPSRADVDDYAVWAAHRNEVILPEVPDDISNDADFTRDYSEVNTISSPDSLSQFADQLHIITKNDGYKDEKTEYHNKGADAIISHRNKQVRNKKDDDLKDFRSLDINGVSRADREEKSSMIWGARTYVGPTYVPRALRFVQGRVFLKEGSDWKRLDLSDTESSDDDEAVEIGYNDYDDCCFDLYTLFILTNDAD